MQDEKMGDGTQMATMNTSDTTVTVSNTNESNSLNDKNVEKLEEVIRQQTELVKRQTEYINRILDAVKLNAIREVPPPPEKQPLKLMTPEDHITKIYDTVSYNAKTYQKPPALKDYEAAVYVLKEHGISNQNIVNFLTNEEFNI